MRRSILIAEAYGRLILHDAFMWRNDFSALHKQVKACSVQAKASQPGSTAAVSNALDVACIFYPKRTLCLQRSTVLVKMLRRRGIHAQMIIGAQKLPFKAHAWVEVNGSIVNDRLAKREKFFVLEVF
jgi:hypothetical protein